MSEYSRQMINYQLEQMSKTLKTFAKSDSWLSEQTRKKLESLSVELNAITYSIEEDFNYEFGEPIKQLSARLWR